MATPGASPVASEHGPTRSPLDESRDNDLDGLLEDYTARLRRGEHPAVEEYASLRPDLADDIRLLFPTMEAVEELVSPSSIEGETPKRLGDFRIVREAGRGGMGVVYEAVQESLDRRVALKIFPREFVGDAKGLERFRREARAAARLHHTNIVPVFGVGEEEGVPYYAMQLIEGQSLDAILEEARRTRSPGKPTFPELTGSSRDPLRRESLGSGSSGTTSRQWRHYRAAATVGLQVAEALAYAHAQGVLHRDIKPSNLLLDERGIVWVTDFGLAKADDDGSRADGAILTQAGDIVGTIAYLAPERLEGKSDARSDIYALGLTLYELVTLQPAFQDENRRRLLRRVAEDSPPPPRQLDPFIPRDLETIILTATARKPERRYASAGRLAEDLRSFLASRPIAARRVSTIERLRGWCRREPTLAALATLVIVLFLAVASLSSFGYLKLRESLDVATTSLERARAAEEEARTAEGRARVELRRSYLAQARASLDGAQPDRRFESLDAVRRAVELSPPPEEARVLRDEAIAALALVDLRVTKRWRKDPRLAFTVAPDLESYAAADPDGDQVVLRRVADGGEIARLVVEGCGSGTLRYSPDGRFLAARPIAGPDRLVVLDLASGESIYSSSSATLATGLGFDSASATMAFVSLEGRVRLLDLARRIETVQYESRPGYSLLALQPSGTRIALASESHGEVLLVEARTGGELGSFDDGHGHRTLVWSDDGSLLVAAGTDNSVGVFEPSDGTLQKRHELERTREPLVETVFNHAGTLLATYSWEPMLRLWDPVGGDPLLSAELAPIAFSPDDRRLAFSLGTYEAGIADVTESDVCRRIAPHRAARGKIIRQQVSPDGRLLASARQDGVVLFDLQARRYLPPLPLASGESALFSPDGRWLLTGAKDGLQRWPLTRVPEPGGVTFGDPETLLEVGGGSSRWVSQSADGKTLAIIGERDRAEIVVLRIEGDALRRTILGPHPNADRISLRPDGRRLASGTWLGTDVKVWDTEAGSLERTISVRDNAFVEYGPDGRWLAVMTPEACFLHDAVTLELVRRVEKPARAGFPGFAAFRGDGKVLAISYGRGSILLVDPDTGVQLALLDAPSPPIGALVFGPDGSHLYAAGVRGSIQDWDLGVLRQELRGLGLDWDEPEP